MERLDLRLSVHAEHDRFLRRMQIEADDVADLAFELRIGGERERFRSPGLYAEAVPDLGDGDVRDSASPRPPGGWPAAGRTSATRRTGPAVR